MGLNQMVASPQCFASAVATVPVRYAGKIEDLVAALVASNGVAAAEFIAELGASGGLRRASFGIAADAQGALPEKFYLVNHCTGQNGEKSLVLQEMASVTWTISANAVPQYTLSNGTDLKEATQAAVISTNLVETRTGGVVREVRSNGVATVEVTDVGEVAGVLRVSTRGVGSFSVPTRMLWN